MKKGVIYLVTCIFIMIALPESRAHAADGEAVSARGRSMMVAGWATLGGAYALSLVVGIPVYAVAIDPCSDATGAGDDLCGAGYGVTIGIMAVPLVGPAILAVEMFKYGTAQAKGFGAFLLVDALAQIAGLAVAIAGHVTFEKGQKLMRKGGFLRPGRTGDRFGIFAAPFAAPGSGGIALAGYF